MIKVVFAITAIAAIVAIGWLAFAHSGSDLQEDTTQVDNGSSFEQILEAKDKSEIAPPAIPEEQNEKNNVNTGSTITDTASTSTA